MPDIDRRPSHDVSRRTVATRMIGSAIAIGAIGWSVHFAGLPRVELEGRLSISPSRADTTYVITESAPLELRRALYENPVVAGGSPGIPAFPEAEGWGAVALNGCRGLPLVVHEVTNTDNSGAGTLRDILENQVSSSNYDIVIFRTGGLITNSSLLQMTASRHCVYIAGQTAPGGGISITGDQRVELRNWNDFVLRYVTFDRMRTSAFQRRGGYRGVIDHISQRWNAGPSGYTLFVAGDSAPNVPLDSTTIQNSMAYEPDRSVIWMLAGGPKVAPRSWRNSVHRNFLMGSGHRMPMCSSLELQFVNNVVYNWSTRGTESNNTASCDWIANYHNSGPAQGGGYNEMPFVVGDNCAGLGTGNCSYSFYVAENRNVQNDFDHTTPADSAWEGSKRQVACRDVTTDTSQGGGWCPSNGSVAPASVRRDTAFSDATPFPINKRVITDAYRDSILNQVGNYRGLDCDGSWVERRDAVDSTRIAWFYSGDGVPGTVDSDTLSPLTPASGTACTDTDSDGIPDDWETAQCGSTTCVTADSVSVSGYLMIEHFLNGSDPDDPEPWAVENGNGNGEPEATFGSGRRVYKVALTTYGDSAALRADTAVVLLGTPFSALVIPSAGLDSVLVVTGTDLGTPLDSAAVQSTVEAWGLCASRNLCSAVDVRDVPIPGGDPGAFLMREWALREAA